MLIESKGYGLGRDRRAVLSNSPAVGKGSPGLQKIRTSTNFLNELVRTKVDVGSDMIPGICYEISVRMYRW